MTEGGSSAGVRRPGPIIIAGGGTAGHAFPAVAVAEALLAHGHSRTDILFVGSRRGLEARLVPEAGFAIVLLPGRGIARRLTLDNVGAALGLIAAIAGAVVLVVRRRPRVVLSVGGYAGVPCALAAVLLRVPLILAESNGVAGAANRLVARWARASAVAFPGSGLPREVLTGNPVRAEILAIAARPRAEARAEARAALGLPSDRLVLLGTGGSLGARRINDAVVGLRTLWRQRADVAIFHVVGTRDWPDIGGCARDDPSNGGLAYRAVAYEHRMALALVAADLVVARAGGTTLAELTVLGLPAILVPLPTAPDDHQTAGAMALARAGAALVVADAELTPSRLAIEADALFADPERLAVMGQSAAAQGRVDAADRVACLLEEHSRGRR